MLSPLDIQHQISTKIYTYKTHTSYPGFIKKKLINFEFGIARHPKLILWILESIYMGSQMRGTVVLDQYAHLNGYYHVGTGELLSVLTVLFDTNWQLLPIMETTWPVDSGLGEDHKKSPQSQEMLIMPLHMGLVSTCLRYWSYSVIRSDERVVAYCAAAMISVRRGSIYLYGEVQHKTVWVFLGQFVK